MKAAKRRLSIFAKPRLRRAELKFGKPRFFPYKDLSLLVGSRHCGELNRGLQNLGSSRKGDGFILFALCKKNQKAHQRFANLWTPGTIQSSAGSEFAKFSGGFCRTRFFAQNAGVKALNRCEVRALQRKELERRLKEQPYSLQTVGYGWVEICGVCGGKGLLWVAIRKGLCKRKTFVRKKVAFKCI